MGEQAVRSGLINANLATDRNPTEGQKRAGNYRKGRLSFHGLEVVVETPQGAYRSGVEPNGKPWKVRLRNSYGYIRGTTGADSSPVDVFLGPHLKSPHVFVINQHNLH